MTKYKVVIKGMTETEREEYIADCVVCDTQEEAIRVKNEMMGPGGIWSESDVYAYVEKVEEDDD